VVRTRRRFYLSRPGRVLLLSTIVLVPAAFLLPFLPGAQMLGFVPMPAGLMASLVIITAAYVIATERLKASFYRRYT
jgi:Mg2+-importing ATPase